MKKRGFLITIAAPSGGGKSTILHKVMEEIPNMRYSISHTTRALRGNEIDGQDYFFTNEADFIEKQKANFFLESANVHGKYYGTSKKFINETLDKGMHVILDIDVQGVAQIKMSEYDLVSIFVLPPSFDVLKQRLIDRKTDSIEVIEQRLENSKKEIDRMHEYDYLVINENLDNAVSAVINIIKAEEHRVSRYSDVISEFYK